MPRKARIDAPGALHHIIVRGIERRKLFREDADRVNFIERLGTIVPATQTQCYGWALMPNHAHLLLRSGSVSIATVMRRLLTGYAVSFNRKYRRHGHLFQNRYKSILCQEDIYLTELLRYIHLNPLRAGLVAHMKALDEYPWAGHGVIMGKRKNDWQNIDYVLSLFGDKKARARREYRSFVQEGIDEGKRPDLIGGGLIRSTGGWQQLKALRKIGIRLKGDERILGDSDFVQMVLEVLRSGKQARTVMARSLVCFWANRELGMTTVDISKQLKIGQAAVSRSSLRGEKIAEENKFSLL